MIVWGGGNSGGSYNDGGRYDPAANTWSATTVAGAPAARSFHTAVWTGREMIVWGGGRNDGGRYNPVDDSWASVPTVGAPSARIYHAAVWTGTEMIVWGGESMIGLPLGDGGRYNPFSKSAYWRPVQLAGAPAARSFHTAVWTGNEMIIWGGANSSVELNNGGRYDPNTDSWSPISATGAPSARSKHTAVWTGTEMILWGGRTNNVDYTVTTLNDGGRYHPNTDSWSPISATAAPSARYDHTAVWTGKEMIIWGGSRVVLGNGFYMNDGGRYDPATDSWSPITTSGAPIARSKHTAVWTGSEMIVFGGTGYHYGTYSATYYYDDTFSYTPSRSLFLYQRQ